MGVSAVEQPDCLWEKKLTVTVLNLAMDAKTLSF